MPAVEKINLNTETKLDLKENNPFLALENKTKQIKKSIAEGKNFNEEDFPEAIAFGERNPVAIQAFLEKYLKQETV